MISGQFEPHSYRPNVFGLEREFLTDDTPHVQSVLLGDNGIGRSLSAGTTVIDMSTISASGIQAIGAELVSLGIDLVDAPVSGGVKGAIDGTLSIMCGGTTEAFGRAKPVLEGMGKTIIHAGDLGTEFSTSEEFRRRVAKLNELDQQR